MILEEQGKEFASSLCDTVEFTGVSTQLDNPHDAFMSGCYFGAVQGYKRGVNVMVEKATELLPDIFNQIANSGFNMEVNWSEEFKKLILKRCFDIE